MDRGWIRMCLQQAGAPVQIHNIAEALVANMPVLVLDGVEFRALHLLSGLTQGCTASCMLYIIVVDPLLCALQPRTTLYLVNDVPRIRFFVCGFRDHV